MPRKSSQIRRSHSIAVVTFQRLFLPGSTGFCIQMKAEGIWGYYNLNFSYDFICSGELYHSDRFSSNRTFSQHLATLPVLPDFAPFRIKGLKV